MISNNSRAFLCLPLTALMFFQGSSCNPKMKANSNNTTNQAPQSSTKAEGLATGIWGGEHIALEVTDGGASIDYDCAHGSITERIVPDRDGKFVVNGFHVKEHPGPLRQDEDTTGQPATYTGVSAGANVTLTVRLTGTDETLGTYTLTRGKTGRVRKCG
ncbi:MAG: hypothetical protein ABJA18_07370 [bacterium]